MRQPFLFSCLFFSAVGAATSLAAAPVKESWDYAEPMKKVAARFRGNEGVVLHVGGSMTIANPYGTWPRSGKGKTRDDEAILQWMHTDKKDKTDGWWLCRTEVEHYRAYTSESGLKSAMLSAGGKRGLPTLEKMLDEYKPRMVTIECGIYDIEDGVPLEEYRKNMAKALDSILDRGAIPILNTIPPFHAQLEKTKQFNEVLRTLAKSRGIPVIDLEREILTLRPDDWYGTLMKRIHLTASEAGGSSSAEPTAENLRKSGYLLRGWLTVRKIAEIKKRVIDDTVRSDEPKKSAFVVDPAFADEKPPNVPPSGFRALFTGKDLKNWRGQIAEDPRDVAKITAGLSKEEIAGKQQKADEATFTHWKAEDGLIHYDGTRRIGNIETREHFGDFELYLDWKIPKGGDSGVFPRNMPQVQIWDPAGGKRNVVGSGGLDNNGPDIPPKQKADRPVGEWNTFYIKMVGDRIWVKLNGVTVIDGEKKGNYWKDFKEPPPEKGPIVLQSHGSHLWFRNLFIRELPVIRQKGKITTEFGHVVDIPATCLDLAGVKYPARFQGRQVQPLEGQSLTPVLRGEASDRRAMRCWSTGGCRAARHGQWKLVSSKEGPWELYDLSSDRTELHDLSAEQPECVEALRKIFDEWRKRNGIP